MGGGYTSLQLQRLSSSVIVGEWGPSAHGPNVNDNQYHFMPLDTEAFNTNKKYFEKVSSDKIKIFHEGYYRIDMRTITHNTGGQGNHVETWLNGERLHLSHSFNMGGATEWRRHATSVVAKVEADSDLQVRVYCDNTVRSYCWHNQGAGYSRLTVMRME